MPPDHIQEILSRLQSVRAVGAYQWESLCPAHEDNRRSLSIGVGKNSRALVNCHAGCSTADVLKKIGLPLNALFQPREDKPFKQLGPIVATYDYVDETGELLFQVTRHNPKDFRQRRPNDTGGWIGSIDGVRKVIYRLPEVLAADAGDWVFVVEGEKDADNIRKLGFVGTCNPGGASKGKSKWLPEFNASFIGKRVCIIRDRDDVGIAHAQHVAAGIHAYAAEVRGPVDPPGDAHDISEWIETTKPLAYGLVGIAEAAPLFDPAVITSPTAPTPAGGSLGERDKNGNLILSPKRTMPTASAFVREFYTHPDGPTLTTYSQLPFIWRNNRHEPSEWAMIEAELFPWLHEAMRYIQNPQTKELELAPFDANPSTVRAAQQTVSAYTIAANNVSPPIWKKPECDDPPADELLVCRSNSIHLPTGKIIPPTPRLFVTASLDFDYDANAPSPAKWLEFLDQVFPGDAESVCLLQQWFGYCLTQDTRQQKILAMIGQRRSGKGTTATVLRRLVGEGNVAGTTVSSFSGQFGMQNLIGKTLAIIPDARFGGDTTAVSERLLSISGEDALDIDRKFLPAVTMKLKARIMILSNDIPKVSDVSGALAGRFLMLRFNQTFYGRENFDLQKQLDAEMPGILLWAIEGWHSLRAMGRFFEPKASRQERQEFEDSASPIGVFVRDCCNVGHGLDEWPADLYAAWRQWCTEQGRDHPGTVQQFGRDLRGAVPGISIHQCTDGRRYYSGISLK
jgi:putative DNA primase/helicase